MTNPYYTFTPPLTPGTRARSDAVNLQFAAVETGFDNLPILAGAITRGLSSYGVESQGATVNTYEVVMGDTRLSNQDGDSVVFKATHTNTGPCTLNVDGLGAVPLVGYNGNAMLAGAIVTNRYYEVRFDNTNTRFLTMSSGDETMLLKNLGDVSVVSPTTGQVLTYTGAGWVNSASVGGGGGGTGIGGGVDIQVLTADGSWTKPSGAGIVDVWAVAGGGGGGSARCAATGTRQSGSAGQGGGISRGRFLASSLSSVETCIVAGNAPGGASITTDATSGQNGTAGSDTIFGASGLVIARGGDNGTGGGTSTSALAGGAGLGAGDYSVGLSGGTGDDTNGGNAEAITTSPTATTQNPELMQCGGGGGGGGVNSTGTGAGDGGDGSLFGDAYTPEQAAWTGQGGVEDTTAPTVGGTFRGDFGAGGGGGGGAGSLTTDAQAGAAGGFPGGGGGGGGGAIFGVGASGAGGEGGAGVIIVVTYLVGSGGSFTVVGGANALEIQDAGSPVGTVYDTLNFIGAGVTVSDGGGGVTDVTIPGSVTIEEQGTPIAGGPHSVLNFIGSNITAADAGSGEATITVTGNAYRGATAYAANTFNTVNNATFTDLSWSTEYQDTDNIITPASSDFTVPSGVTKVRVRAFVDFNDSTALGGSRLAGVRVNGTSVANVNPLVRMESNSSGPAINSTLMLVSPPLAVVATDVITINVIQTQGGALGAGGWAEVEILG